jgi:hypothetical protein
MSGPVEGPAAVAAGRDRTRTIVCIALAFVMLASLPWLVHPYYEANVETNDASMYILCAESLLSGHGYSYVGEPFAIRPPGMSVLLMPILHWRGLDFGAMHFLVNLLGAASILALVWWMAPKIGSFVAAALGLFVWLNPGFRHFANEVMSDVPGLGLTFALFCVERWTDRKPSWKRDLVLGAAIGMSSYMRTILVLVLPAVLIARTWRKLAVARASQPAAIRRETWRELALERLLPLVAGTLLVFVPWTLRASAVAPKDAVDQNFIHSYGVAMTHVDGGDPSSPARPLSDVTNRLPDRAKKVLSLLGSRMDTNDGGPLVLVLGGVIVLACVLLLVREKRSAEIYFFISTFVLLVYFGYRDRLGLPLFAMGWAALAEVAVSPMFGVPSVRARRAIVAVLLTVLAIAGFRYQEGWDELAAEHRANIEQAQAWNEKLPADARLATAIGWHHSVYLGRTVHSLYFAVRRKAREADAKGLEGAARNEMSGAEEVIDKYGLNTVILDASRSDQSMVPYFQLRYRNGVRAGDGWIFRVRP